LPITIGARTLVGPNCSFYSGTHPLDPYVRNGTNGPEAGKPVIIGEDCWLGGNVVVVPGVTIGRGSTIGAGSVVTKDIPEFSVAVGNPAKVIRKLDVTAPEGWPHSTGGGEAEVAAGEKVEVLAGEKVAKIS
jgi:acetyltransferase-like isoleucine patch superfamily enzyme